MLVQFHLRPGGVAQHTWHPPGELQTRVLEFLQKAFHNLAFNKNALFRRKL
jgi:hypothetical protein